MVAAGEELLSRRGYGVTMLDVIELAGAPRGSIYYHFPNGKEELATEVAYKVRRDLEELVYRTSAKVEDPVEFLQSLVEQNRQRLVGSGYTMGCALTGVLVSGEPRSSELERAIGSAVTACVRAIAESLEQKGLAEAESAQLASVVVSSIEGCMIVGRARRSDAPFAEFSDSLPVLVGHTSPRAR